MANPYQQQVFQRKLLYTALILALFTGAWLWRTRLIDAQAASLKIRETERGEVELSGSAARVAAVGSQGLLTSYLWWTAFDLQKKNKWSELKLHVDWLTRLQPHFVTPWLFQSWNLAYNVSVESDRPADRYYYVSEGINLLGRGERQNANNPDLRWSLGFYTQHKICMSDDTNYQRSLVQLSLIPPNERDPARFWRQNARGEAEFNYPEFEKFCAAHPQLVRRLRVGMHKDSVREARRLFTCDKPEDVVAFLQDNFQVPSVYRVRALPAGVPASARGWSERPERPDVRLEPNEGFPVLPPPHADAFDRAALDTDTPARDDINGYAVSHAWFCYAQEPLPVPGETPGSSVEITDPVRQRKPRHMTTLIFRSYPAQGRRYVAEQFQQEGWFDADDWDISDWFEDSKEYADRKVKVGGGTNWSLLAWQQAREAWTKQGDDNHLLFRTPTDEANKEQLAARFRQNHPGVQVGYGSRKLDEWTPEEKAGFDAAHYLTELAFYRQVSNFLHHYHRALVESQEDTVTVRKLFYRAENQLYREGNKLAALATYETPVRVWKDKGRDLTPLQAWLDLVLLRNEDFRRDDFIQEQTAETNLRYMDLFNTLKGRTLREQTAEKAAWTPPGPRTLMGMLDLLPAVRGPFDVEVRDARGRFLPPNVEPLVLQRVMERMNLVPGKKQ